MKKLIIGIVIALVLAATAVPAVSASAQKPLDEVVISPNPATIPTNGTQLFSATAQDASDQTVVGVTYTWEVVAGGGAIDSTGLFTAGAVPGTFTNTIRVIAFKGSVTKTAYATVIVAIPGVLDHVLISPETATLQQGGIQILSATGRDAFNQVAPGVTYGWEVVAGGGVIDGSGSFLAGAVTGTFLDTVKVTAFQTTTTISKTATATVVVAIPGALDHVGISPIAATIPTGGNQQFSATAQDAFNQTVVGVIYDWAVVTGGGTINSTTGKFIAGTEAGTSTIRVTAIQGSITKSVTATITITATPTEKEFRVSPGWSKGKKTGWNGSETPPGWSKGKKTGWNDEDAPPGLSK